MELNLPAELEPFREMVRATLSEILPPEMARRQMAYAGVNSDHNDTKVWTAILDTKGWSVPHWPV